MLIVYAAPFIAGHFVTGHMMFFRYLVLKQYWFKDWKGMPFVQGGLFLIAGITVVLLLYRFKKVNGLFLKSGINLFTIALALYVTNLNPFSQLTYYFIFIATLVNVGLSFLLLVLPYSKNK